MKRLLSLILTLLLILPVCLSLQSCGRTLLYSEGDGELNVLCTTFIPFDFAKKIGGEHVTLTILQDSGTDLHNYTPTVATLDAISEADIFICIGGVSDEAWVHNAIEASENKDITTVFLMDAITPIHAELSNDWSDHEKESDLHDHDHDHNHDQSEHSHEGHNHGADEHIWTSLKNAKIMVETIADCFCSADPVNALEYRKNAKDFQSQLSALDAEYAYFFESIMPTTLVIADRFPFVYLLHDYHIPYVAAFSGCSTEVNSSFEMQIQLIKAVKASNIRFIITIEGNEKSLAQAISEETGCKIVTLNSLQSVKRSEIQNGIDYMDIMKQNLNVLKEASK